MKNRKGFIQFIDGMEGTGFDLKEPIEFGLAVTNTSEGSGGLKIYVVKADGKLKSEKVEPISKIYPAAISAKRGGSTKRGRRRTDVRRGRSDTAPAPFGHIPPGFRPVSRPTALLLGDVSRYYLLGAPCQTGNRTRNAAELFLRWVLAT